MDENTLTALKGSIAKWEGIVAGTIRDLGMLIRLTPTATTAISKG